MSLAPLTPRRVFLWMKLAAIFGIVLLFVLLYKMSEKEISPQQVILKKPLFDTLQTYRKDLPVFEWDNNRSQTFGRKDFSGQWTLLSFWANWCWPCHVELPRLNKVATNELKNLNLQIVLVNVDKDKSDSQQQAEEFLLTQNIQIKNLFDPFGLLSQTFAVSEFPYHILVNPKGKILFSEAGAIDWTDKEVLESLIKLLKQPPGEAPETSPSSKIESAAQPALLNDQYQDL